MIKVLVVDDSLFMRKLISRMLSSDPEIEVIDVAKNGREAIEKTLRMRPNVITLDLNMPGLNGLQTLKKIMAKCPTPAVIISAHTKKDAEITLKCLEEGAVGYILKPSGELSLDIENVREILLQEIKAAAAVDAAKIKRSARRTLGLELRTPNSKLGVVVIGASTGGPPAVEALLSMLPADFPSPIVVVQHTPSLFFTEGLTERLDKICHLEAKVSEDGDRMEAGTIYVVPNGFSLGVSDNGFVSLIEDPPGVLSPSIDRTMSALAGFYHQNIIGVILTGMGSDGLKGMKAVKDDGGVAIAQDEESSVIFGMPGAVISAGLADKVLPVEKIAEALVELVESGERIIP